VVWAGGDDPRYLDAMRRPFRTWTRVDIESRDGTVLYRGLPFVDGSLTANLQNRVTRKVNLVLAGTNFFPVDRYGDVDPGALLAPYANRARVWSGIEYGDGSIARFPIFYGSIQTTEAPGMTSTTVECEDLASDVVAAPFEVPTSSVATNTVYAQWQSVIEDVLPDATFEQFPGGATGSPIGPLTWESDRGQALDDMAAGVGCMWWSLADGEFVMRTQPWSQPGRTPAFTISPAGLGGDRTCSFDATPSVTRQGVVNSVVFSSERLDGSPPLISIARDLDASSPTYYLGPLGKRPLLIKNQAPVAQSQVDYAAKVQLHYGKSLSFAFKQVSIPADPSIELGDLARLLLGPVRSDQVITGFTLPFRENAMMTLTLRAYVPLTGV